LDATLGQPVGVWTQRFASAIARSSSSPAGQLLLILSVVLAVWILGSASALANGVLLLFGIAFLWVHCIRPPLVYFRVSRAVFWFASVWTFLEVAFAALLILDELSDVLAMSRTLWLTGLLISLAYVVVVGLVFWPKYSILIRLFGRSPSA
jgi:hypothetical protein